MNMESFVQDIESIDVNALTISEVMLLKEYAESFLRKLESEFRDRAEEEFSKPENAGRSNITIGEFMLVMSTTPKVSLDEMEKKFPGLYQRLLTACGDEVKLSAKGQNAIIDELGLRDRIRERYLTHRKDLSITRPVLEKVMTKRLSIDEGTREMVLEKVITSNDVKYMAQRKAEAAKN